LLGVLGGLITRMVLEVVALVAVLALLALLVHNH
jgi:hypothetical protein